MSFTFRRNPERLLGLCGLSPIRDRRQEKLFMGKTAAPDAWGLRPLVLVIGGFLDQILGNSYAVSARYPADLRARHNVQFRERYESRKMHDIMNIYTSRGHSVALIGHSWGENVVVNLVARKFDAPIDLLISLNPVSRKGAPRQKIPNVRHWLNIHIDYSQSTWFDIPNLMAHIGGPWGVAENADMDISYLPDMTHAWAWGMLERYGKEVLRERAEGWR